MISVYTLHIDYLIELIVLDILTLTKNVFLIIREYFFEIITAFWKFHKFYSSTNYWHIVLFRISTVKSS